MYFFIDELVFSRINLKEDEITLRAAMVRDIVRAAWELNSYCAENDLAFHFICNLRPEIRNLINDLDAEAGKYLDGKDVELTWYIKAEEEDKSLIHEVMNLKIEKSYYKKIDVNSFLAESINFGGKKSSVKEFILTNTWGRPRDIVRLLIAIQKKSPNSIRIGETEIKAGLDEYSRMSLKELIDELGVQYGDRILESIRRGITKRYYKNIEEIWDALRLDNYVFNKKNFLEELFSIGFIGAVDRKDGRYFWAHRGETYLKPGKEIVIHPALWNELSIRNK